MWLKSCKVLLYLLFLMSSTKNITISCAFNLISNSWQNPRWRPLLVTSQASNSSPPIKKIPHQVKKIKGVLLKVKSFRNTATYEKPLKGGRGVPSIPLPCTTVGYELAVYFRGLIVVWLLNILNIRQKSARQDTQKRWQ